MGSMSAVVPWRLMGDGVSPVLNSTMSWSTEAPLEVKLVFGAVAEGEDIEWTFARDLLLDGIKHGNAGHADVKVHTTCDTLYLELTSPFGQVKLKTEITLIGQFLAAAYGEVPRGKEELDVDAAIAEILGNGLEDA